MRFVRYDAMNRPAALTRTAAAPSRTAFNKANRRTGWTVTDNSWLNYPAATPSTVSYTATALNWFLNWATGGDAFRSAKFELYPGDVQ